MKRKLTHVWRIKYKAEGVWLVEWYESQKALDEVVESCDLCNWQYTITKYELKEVQDD